MSDLSKKLAGIEEKIKQLIHENSVLSQSNANLIDQNNKLSETIATQETKVANLEGRLQTGSGLETAPREDAKEININTKELKKQLDQYTKEIDKCIEWLYNN